MWVIQMITHRKEKLVELCDSGIFSSNRNLETVKKKHISEELIYRAALFIASRHREAYSAGVFFVFLRLQFEFSLCLPRIGLFRLLLPPKHSANQSKKVFSCKVYPFLTKLLRAHSTKYNSSFRILCIACTLYALQLDVPYMLCSQMQPICLL